MNESLESAVLRARKEWLEKAMAEANYSVTKMAAANNLHRTYAYKALKLYAPHVPRKTLAELGVKPQYRKKDEDMERKARGGNAAWKALDVSA